MKSPTLLFLQTTITTGTLGQATVMEHIPALVREIAVIKKTALARAERQLAQQKRFVTFAEQCMAILHRIIQRNTAEKTVRDTGILARLAITNSTLKRIHPTEKRLTKPTL